VTQPQARDVEAEESLPRRASILTALRYRDFRLLWLGLLISNLGTWMQFTAMGFFVAQMAGSQHQAALDLGILGAARAVPVLLLSPLAGVVADHLPRRRVLFVTNGTMALAALVLAVLATFHRLDLISLVVLSAVNSAANGFDSPTRQSWVPMLVDREYLGNAVGLNSVAFNAPAVIGPALAGLLIVWIGVAGAFYFNAAATLAVIVAVMLMRPSPPSARRREPTLLAMQQGIIFIVRHPALRWIVLAQFVTAVLTRPYSQLIAALAASDGPSRRSASAGSAARSSRRTSHSASGARGCGCSPAWRCRQGCSRWRSSRRWRSRFPCCSRSASGRSPRWEPRTR
jgi:MFS family permease